MKTLLQLRRTVMHRMELEQEQAELAERMKALRLELRTLVRQEEEAREAAEKLEGISGLLLRLTGKKEARQQEAQRSVAAALSARQNGEFRLHTAEQRIKEIEEELAATERDELDWIALLEPRCEDLEAVKNAAMDLRQARFLRHQLPELANRLAPLVEKALVYDTYGDVQTHLSGGRYDNRAKSLKEQNRLCQPVLTTYSETVRACMDLLPEDLRPEWDGPWTASEYLTELPTDFRTMEMTARLENVKSWPVRLERSLRNIDEELDRRTRQANDALRQRLLVFTEEL